MNQLGSEIKNKCAKCGKAITLNPSGSLTAWLFRRAECQCETPAQDSAAAVVEKSLGAQASSLLQETSESEPTGLSGRVINDRYEVMQQIGSGGMASVYRVLDKSNGSIYVLKMISSQLAKQEALAKRLEHEATAVSKLTHAHICAVYDYGRDKSNDQPFLIMEYVAGQTLDQVLKNTGRLAEERALDIFIQVAEALVYAHGRGVVHCDLKPGNIMITKTLGKDEFVKIVDFGIARITQSHNADKTQVSQSGELVGSPLYMSPEQCRGDQLDERSDIYSFGCMVYEAVSGEPPFKGENPVRVILKQLSEEAKPLPTELKISRNLKSCLFSCLEKNAAFRYTSANELLADLERIRDGEAIKKKRRLRLPRLISVLEGSIIFALAVLGLSFYFFNSNLFTEFRTRQWEAQEQSARKSFINGELGAASSGFSQAADLSQISAEQQLKSLEELALIYHISGRPEQEDSLSLRMEPLRKKAGPDTRISKAELSLELEQLKSPDIPVDKTNMIAFEILYSCYLLNKQGESKYSLAMLDQARELFQQVMNEKPNFVAAFNNEYELALKNEVRRMEEDGNDRSLLLASTLDRLGSYYNDKKAADRGSKYAQKAAKYVLEFTPQALEARARTRAAEILSHYAMLLKEAGSADWEHYKIMSEQFEENK